MIDYITTATGLKFYFENPQPDQICLADIAFALSNTNRWGGHAYPAMNVAHHSVLVAEALQRAGASYMVQLQGLFHDAAEAYLGDIPTPIKNRLPEYQAMELLTTGVIFDVFSIQFPLDQQVHMQDIEMRKWEARDIMPVGVCGVDDPVGNRPSLFPWTPDESEYAFVGRYHTLAEALGILKAA